VIRTSLLGLSVVMNIFTMRCWSRQREPDASRSTRVLISLMVGMAAVGLLLAGFGLIRRIWELAT